MNNISYISNSHVSLNKCQIKMENLDIEFDKILDSCGINSRSRGSSTSSNNDELDKIPATDSFKNDKKSEKDNNSNELYCSESSNFPNIPFGSTPPDTQRIRELYIQYMSHIQLKKNVDDDQKFDSK